MTTLRDRSSLGKRLAMPALLLALVAAWNWPILTGRQPAGGDATSFFFPLMVFYSKSLSEGPWPPLWNDRWGYGFPALAESQMGAIYPPHLLLFSIFSPETAYGLNLLIHMALAAWWAYLAARTMGLGMLGAGLCGFVFFSGDFFTIHAPHQWAYTSGCWFGLAVVLAWRVLELPRGEPSTCSETLPGSSAAVACVSYHRAQPLLLAAVLALQMLAGHFQLAFYTQVMVLLLTVARWFFPATNKNIRWRTTLMVLAAWLGGWLLAAVQWLPTAELFRLAPPAQDPFNFVSGFANTPWHLVNYLAGALFHRNPLWRGVAWSPAEPGQTDPWHTSPEECLNYVGLLPLCLACAAAWRWRHEGRVRLWVVLSVVSLLLSFGPYLPGYRWLVTLPGFGWFRSAARWNLSTTFWLAMLAGWGFERATAGQLRRWMKNFTIMWITAALLLGGAFWWTTRLPTRPDHFPNQIFETVWRWTTPWKDADAAAAIPRNVHRPPAQDERTLSGLATAGYELRKIAAEPTRFSLHQQFARVLFQEVLPFAGILAGMLALSWSARLPAGWLKGLMAAVIVADLALLTLIRPLAWERLIVLRESPVLQALQPPSDRQPDRQPVVRSVDALGNLPLAVGGAAVLAYRTLDLPVFPLLVGYLAEVGRSPVPPEAETLLWLSGVRSSITRQPAKKLGERAAVQPIADPLILSLLWGKDYVEQLKAFRPELLVYHAIHWSNPSAQAWVIPRPSGKPLKDILRRLPDRAVVRPAELQRVDPQHVVMTATVDEPALLVLTDLYDPGWEAVFEHAGSRQPVKIHRAFDAWRAVELPATGSYRVTMRYQPQAFRWGAWISAAAWLVGIVTLLGFAVARRRPAHQLEVPTGA